MGVFVKELRIGNYVKRRSKDELLKVDLALLAKIQRQPFLFKPIPLTEEWMLKFGANKRDIGDSCIYFVELELNNFFHLEISDEGYIIIECDDSYYSKHLKHLKYVHQLQNLWFDLKGEELTLKHE